ncbi:MAG: DNA-3-methyladenine glycosylase [Candidatus Bathyarchaeota archaeon]|nr:DNA-3-methyladenine glycosylase [Candidatus Termiticorpusculum sp.]
MSQKTTMIMKPRAPFDLVSSSLVFTAGDRRVRSFQKGVFTQVINVNGVFVWVQLSSKGQVNKPKLMLELFAEEYLSKEKIQQVKNVVCRIFSLNKSLNSFYSYVQEDPIMSQITQKLCGFKFPTTPTVFEALVDAIVEQQISIKVARSIEDRLAIMFGESVNVGREVFFAFPSAIDLADAGVEKIRQAGLSARKASYIHGVAELIADRSLDLNWLKDKDSGVAIGVLDEIRGVGVWTAELTLLRGMGWFDILPADDFGIRRAISRYYCGGKLINAVEARQIAEKWGSWKGLAAFYLLAAEAQGVLL